MKSNYVEMRIRRYLCKSGPCTLSVALILLDAITVKTDMYLPQLCHKILIINIFII